MTKDKLNKIFSKEGISLLQEIGNQVFLIEHADQTDEKQVLKVIDIIEKAKLQANEKYSEEVVKQLLGIIHGNELIWNEKITLTQCEYLVRILEDYIVGSPEGDKFLYAIRMPYYRTLSSLICEGELDENKIINLGIDICNSLRTLHHDGTEEFYQNETVKFGTVLHLDIKPDNIFYEEKDGHGTFMLGDFETLIEKGKYALPMKTKGYYAPEMENVECIPTEAADIFSVGMVLYRCFCDSEEELDAFWKARCIGQEGKIPKNCSSHLWNVIEHATNPNPMERYQSAIELQSALQKINVNKAIVAEVMKEKAESDAALSSVVAIVEAGILLSEYLKKVKKLSSKIETLDFGRYGVYEGGTKNGNPHGKGKWTYRCGNETKTFVGTWEWVKKKKMKVGKEKYTYTGMLCNGKSCGLCQCEFQKIGTYCGITEDGDFRIGTMEWVNGDTYFGEWASKDDTAWMHGEGALCYADGRVQVGRWEYGTFVGDKE